MTLSLDKDYTKMQTADDPGDIGTINQTQIGEIEGDMVDIEEAINQNESDIAGKASVAEVTAAKNCDNHVSGSTNKVFTATEQTKLATIEENATGDQTGAEIKALYEAESDTNNYSDSEKAKLGAIDATHYLAPLDTITELEALTGMSDKARVYVEAETTDYFYDKQAVSGAVEAPPADGGYWRTVVSSGETAASVKAKYESNVDTNAYTDSEKTKVGTVATNADVTADAISGATVKTAPDDSDKVPLFDTALKYISFLNLKIAIGKFLMPVGTLREFNVSTNPATLFGFGTWTLYGVGRTTVCIDSADTDFDTVDEEYGAKTHTLTAAQSGLPAHNHNLTDVRFQSSGTNYFAAGSNYAQVVSANTGNNTAANAAQGHNNVQPSKVVYRWVRTA